MPERDPLVRQQSSRRPARQDSPENILAAGLIALNESVRPFHEWVAGQRAYFNQQGYTDDEARAMAAAMFVSLFGTNISRTIADDIGEGGQV